MKTGDVEYSLLISEIKVHKDGTFCEIPNTPAGSMISFASEDSTVYVSDEAVVQIKGYEYILYTVILKKNSENSAEGSIYTLEYVDDKSGNCNGTKLMQCENSGELCLSNKCILKFDLIWIVKSIGIRSLTNMFGFTTVEDIITVPEIETTDYKLYAEFTVPGIIYK